MICPSCRAENSAGASFCAHCASPLAGIGPGSVVASRYEILEPLGRGGMGVVYKARDRSLDEVVAIKMLRADVAGTPEMEARFRAEIKLARRVTHKNVCRIHEYGEEAGLRYISMQFVDGLDLKRLLHERHGLSPDEAYEIAIQVARGLEAIHEEGIVHRDLKTPNIMLDDRGVVRLMDFGIAKQAGAETAQGLTATGMIVGTPEYMSPEQAQGLRIDARSDIYALGVVLFELFTGDVPFRGDTPIATILKHMQQPPPLEGPQAAALPGPLVPVLRKALAKDPADRHASARELAEDLERARSAARGSLAAAGSRRDARAPQNLAPGQATAPGAAALTSPTPAAMPTPSPISTAVPMAVHTRVTGSRAGAAGPDILSADASEPASREVSAGRGRGGPARVVIWGGLAVAGIAAALAIGRFTEWPHKEPASVASGAPTPIPSPPPERPTPPAETPSSLAATPVTTPPTLAAGTLPSGSSPKILLTPTPPESAPSPAVSVGPSSPGPSSPEPASPGPASPSPASHGPARGWIGVQIRSLTTQEAASPDVVAGAYVKEVVTGGPAERAGLRAGDIVVSADGQPTPDARTLSVVTGAKPSGSTVRLETRRGTTTFERIVVVTARPESMDRPARDRDSAKVWFERGLEHGRAGRDADAIEAYRQSLELRPDNPQAWYNTGLARQRLRDLDQAVNAFREAVRLKPDYAAAWAHLGGTYLRQRQFGDAARAYQEAVRLEPANSGYWLTFGLACLDNGDRSGFEAAYRRLKAQDPQKAEELRRQALRRNKGSRVE